MDGLVGWSGRERMERERVRGEEGVGCGVREGEGAGGGEEVIMRLLEHQMEEQVGVCISILLEVSLAVG